jgi:hypothetical protein
MDPMKIYGYPVSFINGPPMPCEIKQVAGLPIDGCEFTPAKYSLKDLAPSFEIEFGFPAAARAYQEALLAHCQVDWKSRLLDALLGDCPYCGGSHQTADGLRFCQSMNVS